MDSLEYLQIRLDQLSENKIFIGLIMIMVNMGARFLIEELSDDHREIIKSPYFRKIVIFCSVFMATRDIGVAILVTLIFTILMNEILKDDSKKTTIDDSTKNNKNSAKQELDKKIDELKLIKDSL
tara:strand:+ start:113 stop:487 length:375 start_codon:yes stop_codon:yes gene_type:complete